MFYPLTDAENRMARALLEYAERVLVKINLQFELSGKTAFRYEDTPVVSLTWSLGELSYNLLVGLNAITPVLYYAQGNIWSDDLVTYTRLYSHINRQELTPEKLETNLLEILTVLLQLTTNDLNLSGSLRN